MEFSSAWEQRHSSSFVPLAEKELHLSHPPSLQFFTPRGVQLYPVEIILLSFTITAATFLFTQLLLVATSFAMFMKYWSQVGLFRSMGVCSSNESIFWNSSESVPLFSILCSAIFAHSSSCWPLALPEPDSPFSNALKSSRFFGSPSLFLFRIL